MFQGCFLWSALLVKILPAYSFTLFVYLSANSLYHKGGGREMQTSPLDYFKNHSDMYSGEWPTLAEVFRISAKMQGDKTAFRAFVPKPHDYSYKTADTLACELAQILIDSGVKAGDKVGVTGKNSPEWALAWLSALYAGAVVVPVDVQLKNEEISELMKRADVGFLLC
jgi:long-chain acyl-CoA synthetase